MRDVPMKNKASSSCRVAVWFLGLCLVTSFSGGALLSTTPAFADSDPGARKRASRRVTPTKRRGTKRVESYWDADFIVGLSSDYIFRGFSQNDDRITPQLEFALNFRNGAHFSILASALEEDYFDAQAEVKYTIGYVHDVSNEIDIDYGVVYYYYPESDFENGYSEIYVNLIHQMHPNHSVDFGLRYVNEYFNETGEFYYASARYSYEWKGLLVWAGVGWNYFDDPAGYLRYTYGSDDHNGYLAELAARAAGGTDPLTARSVLIDQDTGDHYNDFSVGVGRQFNEFLRLSLELTNTDAPSESCSSRCGENAVLSVFWQF